MFWGHGDQACSLCRVQGLLGRAPQAQEQLGTLGLQWGDSLQPFSRLRGCRAEAAAALVPGPVPQGASCLVLLPHELEGAARTFRGQGPGF